MENLPKKIKSIEVFNKTVIENGIKMHEYILNNGREDVDFISISLPTTFKYNASCDIIDDTHDFVNGFKLVQTANKEYAYVREEDNTLLPYRYDIATDFNEYGYAMVGKDDRVSWIDRKFRYFDADEEKFLDEEERDYDKFNGFISVSDFSNGEIPLSRVGKYDNTISDNKYFIRYLGIDGKIKNFRNYDGTRINEYSSLNKFLYEGTDFDKNGIAVTNTYKGQVALLASGYYILERDLIELCKNNGILKTLERNIKIQERDYYKFLKDVEFSTGLMSEIDIGETDFKILGIECMKDEIISNYGEDVYNRASNEVEVDNLNKHYYRYASRPLAVLKKGEEVIYKIVDLKLLQSLLAKRGIPSYIDYVSNVFYYNAINFVKKK